jgi:hypothetical protein
MNNYYIQGFIKRAAEYGLSSDEALTLLKAAEKPGLWANIRAKRARGEKPAKPGDKDYPDREQWKKLTKAAGRLSALKDVLREMKRNKVTLIRDKNSYLKKMQKIMKKTHGIELPIEALEESLNMQGGFSPGYSHTGKIMAIPRKLDKGTSWTTRSDKAFRKLPYSPTHQLLHEGGHMTHLFESPSSEQFTQKGKGALALERLANNNAILRLRKFQANENDIQQYKNLAEKAYATYRENFEKNLSMSPMFEAKRALKSPAVSIELPKGINVDKFYEPRVARLRDGSYTPLKEAAVAAWQRSEGKNPEGGLNAKGRASYKRETGGTLKAPVTESNPSGERAKRQNSFCSRMCGMKRVNTGSEAKSDPDSRINKSLRKWNCKCGEDHSSIMEKLACSLFK